PARVSSGRAEPIPAHASPPPSRPLSRWSQPAPIVVTIREERDHPRHVPPCPRSRLRRGRRERRRHLSPIDSALRELAGIRSDSDPIVTCYLNTRWADEHQRERVRLT